MQTIPRRRLPAWAKPGLVFLLGYVFLSSINMMGGGFELIGAGFNERLVALTTNPFAGLMVGIVATAVAQSSTLVTTLTVGLVAAGTLDLHVAVPVIMGANIGSTVTAVLVAMGFVGKRGRFRRAFAAATMNDCFNILSVLVFFPLELGTHVFERISLCLAGYFEHVTKFSSPRSPLTAALSVFEGWAVSCAKACFGAHEVAAGVATVVVSLALMYASLFYLVTTTRSFLAGSVEKVLDRYFFRNPATALMLGFILTALILSSGVTTGLTVPLITAGVLTMEQVFPYTMGANVGTTVTALIAAIGTGQPAGLAIALVHFLFNMAGVVIVFPFKRMRAFPVFLARQLAGLTLRSRWYALAYILVVFFLIPFIFLFLWG